MKERFQKVASHAFFVVPLGFYSVTCSRTPGWADAPLIARAAHKLDLDIWVNSHNLFTLLGAAWMRCLPDSLDPHYKLNLLCALLGAMTVQTVFSIGTRLTGNVLASSLGAVALMVSHSLWWHSTMLEVYTLSSLLLVVIVLLLLRHEQTSDKRNLFVAAFCFGLACSNHAQMWLLLFGFLALMLSSLNRGRLTQFKTFGLLAASFTVGFSIYIWVFGSALLDRLPMLPTQTLTDVLLTMLDQTTGGSFREYMFPTGVSLNDRLFWWSFYGGLFLYNFVSPALVFGLIGVWAWATSAEHRPTLVFVGATFLAQLAWSANYFVWDMYAFALPAYVLFALFVTYGIAWASARGPTTKLTVYCLAPTLLLPVYIYSRTPQWIATSDDATAALEALPQYRQAKAFWDPLEYFFNPNKRSYDRVKRYSRVVLSELDAGACYWGDDTKLFYTLKYYYQDVLEQRTDVSYELIFGMFGDQDRFRNRATHMAIQLARGCPLYIESVGYPERETLNYVYAMLDGTMLPAQVAGLPEEVFMTSFPVYGFEALEVDAQNGARIFRIRRR